MPLRKIPIDLVLRVGTLLKPLDIDPSSVEAGIRRQLVRHHSSDVDRSHRE